MIGLVFLGAGAILYMRSRQTPTSTEPALTLYPSTQADESTVINMIATVHRLATLRAAPMTSPTGV